MNARGRLLLLAFMAIGEVARAELAPGPVVVAPLQTDVSAAQFFFLRRALKDAERRNASAFVIDMNTYGGAGDAAIDSMDALLKTRVPTFTYINSKAFSAGALIAIATGKIYMAPTGVIGAAAPVLSTGEDLPKTMSDKTISGMSAMARAAAQKNGHNPELADAFIDKQKEVKIGDVVIDSKDTLLTLSAPEAARLYNDKPLLAAGIAPTLEEMLQQATLRGAVERVEPTGFERAAIWITTLAPLLLLGGIIGAYIEFKTPGFGIPGLAALVCFGLFFAGHYIAGLAGWEVVVCFAIGLALVLGELLLHPGTIVPGLLGLLLIAGALVWAMIDRYPSESAWPSDEMLLRPLLNLLTAAVIASVLMAVLARVLPHSPLYRHLALQASVGGGSTFAVPAEARSIHPGMLGTASTPLRPSGKAEFGEQLIDVVSQGDFIDGGAAVQVVLVDGTRVLVERA